MVRQALSLVLLLCLSGIVGCTMPDEKENPEPIEQDWVAEVEVQFLGSTRNPAWVIFSSPFPNTSSEHPVAPVWHLSAEQGYSVNAQGDRDYLRAHWEQSGNKYTWAKREVPRDWVEPVWFDVDSREQMDPDRGDVLGFIAGGENGAYLGAYVNLTITGRDPIEPWCSITVVLSGHMPVGGMEADLDYERTRVCST